MPSRETLRQRFAYDNMERRKELDPQALLTNIELRSGQTFIDVGCGQGFFAIPAAKIVGEKGKVYALDADFEYVSILRKNIAKEGIRNISLTAGRAEDLVLCEACADIIFLGQVLHDFADPLKALLNARRMIKSTGRLINLDWKKVKMEIGPPLERRFDERQAIDFIKSVMK